MSDHLPELGQWAFSNSEFYEHEVSSLTEAALSYLFLRAETLVMNHSQEIWNLGSNCGSKLFTSTFLVRDYCWCDGRSHPNTCPPNFQYGDYVLNWYKHFGRSMSANRELSPDETNEMLISCLECIDAVMKVTDVNPGRKLEWGEAWYQ